MSIAQFQEFFDHCVGTWTTERTYHYLTHQEVERSHTEFIIHPINSETKARVLSDNQRSTELKRTYPDTNSLLRRFRRRVITSVSS